MAHIPFTFTFPVGGQPDPSKLAKSLPLIYKKAETYTFNNIRLSYDQLSTPKVHTPITVTVKSKASFVPKLQILEIIDTGSSKLSTLLQNEGFEITTITMKQFVASRDEMDGKYDIIAIPEGTYSTAGVQGKDHATTNVLNDITNLKANEIITQFINKGQPVILEKNAVQNKGKLQTNFGEYTSSNKNVIIYDKNKSTKQQDLISDLGNLLNSTNYKPRPRFELTEKPDSSATFKPKDKLTFKFNMLRPTDVASKILKLFYISTQILMINMIHQKSF